MNKNKNISILIIYTGGTIGMVKNPESGGLNPFDFSHIQEQVPELKEFGYKIDTLTFDPLIDSSDASPDFWIKLAGIIEQNYSRYDGFIILHGTDTMAYSAAALSFLLEDLQKPVIFTGSQLPIGMLRTDGKENLISSVEIAAAQKEGQPIVPEVALYFENRLFRGNRTTKISSEHFNAFSSPNYPVLAEAGIHIKYNHSSISYPTKQKTLNVHKKIDPRVAIVKIHPGISKEIIETTIQSKNIKGIIFETFGAGNAPAKKWLINLLKNAIKHNKIIVNVTQCISGVVDMTKYENGKTLLDAGLISGYNITTEAAVTKLMFLLGQNFSNEEIITLLNKSIRGEIDV